MFLPEVFLLVVEVVEEGLDEPGLEEPGVFLLEEELLPEEDVLFEEDVLPAEPVLLEDPTPEEGLEGFLGGFPPVACFFLRARMRSCLRFSDCHL